MADLTTLGLNGSIDPFDSATFFILNQAADLNRDPKFPGSDILYKYSHLFDPRSKLDGGTNVQTPKTPEGVFVSDIFFIFSSVTIE